MPENIINDEFMNKNVDSRSLVCKLKNSISEDCGLAVLSSFAATAGGLSTLYQIHQNNITVAAIQTILTVTNAGFFMYRCGTIANKYRQITKTLEELEIKEIYKGQT
jgi:hypothetical protein